MSSSSSNNSRFLPGKDLMQLRVLHRTTYSYAGKASESFNELRLRPLRQVEPTPNAG